MKIAFYINIVAPHQLPLATEVVKLVGEDDFRYVYQERNLKERIKLGWGDGITPDWCIPYAGNESFVEDVDVLMSGVRDIGLFERRAVRGKITFYASERWFKPFYGLPGWIRLLDPAYFKMAKRMVKWLNADLKARYLPTGPWAAKDMRLLGVDSSKMIPWGYFMEPSKFHDGKRLRDSSDDVLRLLWVGRFLDWKCVPDIIRAVGMCTRAGKNLTLDIYGFGKEETKLKNMVSKMKLNKIISFNSPVPIGEVRNLMHTHDVYVLASNAFEGWGAVVSEALEEGMKVVGTYEAGASAAILPASNLYHSRDWRRLAEILQNDIPQVSIGEWTAKCAAQKLVNLAWELAKHA